MRAALLEENNKPLSLVDDVESEARAICIR